MRPRSRAGAAPLRLGLVLLLCLPSAASAQRDMDVWREFAGLLRTGPLPEERLRPYVEVGSQVLARALETIRQRTDWTEWDAIPQVFAVDDRRHFVLPLTFGGRTRDFVFTFQIEDGRWYLQHIESILIRLDRLDAPPTSRFPDLAEPDKAWIRAELEVTEQVRLFNFLAREGGRDAAFDWFRDGAGYALAARTWVPMFALPEAFIRYLCWEQANLRGNAVTLERLEPNEARVRIRPLYLRLYGETGHLREQIPAADYRRLFEIIWQDRASHAGWRLRMDCTELECLLSFTR